MNTLISGPKRMNESRFSGLSILSLLDATAPNSLDTHSWRMSDITTSDICAITSGGTNLWSQHLGEGSRWRGVQGQPGTHTKGMSFFSKSFAFLCRISKIPETINPRTHKGLSTVPAALVYGKLWHCHYYHIGLPPPAKSSPLALTLNTQESLH